MGKTSVQAQDVTLWLLGAALAAIVLFLYIVQPILPAFLAGLVLAYVLDPVVERLSRVWGRLAACLLPVVLAYLFFVVVFVVGVPLLVQALYRFAYGQVQLADILQVVAYVEQTLGVPLNVQTAREHLENFGSGVLAPLLQGLSGVFASLGVVANMLALLIITPLVTFYLLYAWPHITSWVQTAIPPRHRVETLAVLGRIDSKIAGFLRGQFLLVVCQGLIYGTGLWLVGMSAGFALGLMAGLLSVIPMIGGPIGFIFTLLVGIAEFQWTAGWVPYALIVAVFACGSAVEQFILAPKLLGQGVGLHPLWIIFALMAGGQLAGVLGMLLAVPVAAVVSEVLPLLWGGWQRSKLYRGASS